MCEPCCIACDNDVAVCNDYTGHLQIVREASANEATADIENVCHSRGRNISNDLTPGMSVKQRLGLSETWLASQQKIQCVVRLALNTMGALALRLAPISFHPMLVEPLFDFFI